MGGESTRSMARAEVSEERKFISQPLVNYHKILRDIFAESKALTVCLCKGLANASTPRVPAHRITNKYEKGRMLPSFGKDGFDNTGDTGWEETWH